MAINIIGHFGGNKSFNDGQTVKTRTVFNALLSKNNLNLRKTDTYFLKRNPFLFLWQLFMAICLDKVIIVLLSENGRKLIFPLLYWCTKLGRKRIYHYVIGGKFSDEVAINKKMNKYADSFKANWVESNIMVQKLQSVGINNAIFIPNFKSINPLKNDELVYTKQPPFRFCTFSRVMKEKGIENAISAILNINKQYQDNVVLLDIYGPVDNNYRNEFNELMNQCDESIQYKGIVKSEDSVNVLKDYFMLLFPTSWPGEGMPGTIIDALCAGIPIIASNWNYAKDIITHGDTALIYDFDKPELLEEQILFAIRNYNIVNNMKVNCIQNAEKFTEEKVVNMIISELNNHV